MLDIQKIAIDGRDEELLSLSVVFLRRRCDINLEKFKRKGTMPGHLLLVRVQLVEGTIVGEDLRKGTDTMKGCPAGFAHVTLSNRSNARSTRIGS